MSTVRAAGHTGDAGRLRHRVRLWTRLGLRGRVTFMFTLGAFLLSVIMGGVSYFTARHYLVGGRESTSVQQAYSNARVIRTSLAASPSDPSSVLGAIRVSSPNSVLVVGSAQASTSLVIQVSTIPAPLRRLVDSGTPASQNFVLAGRPQIAVGVPILETSEHASYYEVFDLSDLQHTLRVLALALVAAGVITTALGAAVGRSASGRSLRPLIGVSRAAVAIAGGRLDTRLPSAAGDPDLAGLTRSFNLMVDQLEERIEREHRFTSDVSHELRSPLTTLSASLGVLESHQHELSPRARRALSLLGDDLHRFERLVADLLEISRSDTGSADVVLEQVEVNELVRRAVDSGARTLSNLAEAPRVEIDPALARAHLHVDKRRFERVMANLLENAALYGGGATAVTASPGPPRDGRPTVRVAVEDAGSGVPEPERARVFERFYRGQASGRRGRGTGSGLGLSLVAEHVRLNRGRVWVEEPTGGGARFVVELPADPDPDPDGDGAGHEERA